MIPKMKQPIMLTANVPKGKEDTINCWNNLDVRYLNTVPINPPVPIINNNLNIKKKLQDKYMEKRIFLTFTDNI